jgi:hypothetical protein
MTDYAAILAALSRAGAKFIIVGGAAAVAHGSVRLTEDIDIVYERSAENLSHIVAALTPFEPYPRGAPPGLPFQWDTETLGAGLNFTLVTRVGSVDLLGEISGGNFETLEPETLRMNIFGVDCRCLTLERLIQAKKASGRPKDFEAIAELESLLEEGS